MVTLKLFIYDDGNGTKQRRIEPRDATSYLTTRGNRSPNTFQFESKD